MHTSTATSSACRSTIPTATGSPSFAAPRTTGASSYTRESSSLPVCRPTITCRGVRRPKWAGTARSSAVRGPRPSPARTHAPTASRPIVAPPAQSPEIAPSAGKRT